MDISSSITAGFPILILVVAAAAIWIIGDHRGELSKLNPRIMIVAAVASAAFTLSLLPRALDGEVVSVVLFQAPGSPITISLTLDLFGIAYQLVSSCLFIPAAIYAPKYLELDHESPQNNATFLSAYTLTVAGAMVLGPAGGLFTAFLAWELVTWSTYWLVPHKKDEKAEAMMKKYFIYTLASGVSFGVAVAILWANGVDTTFRPGGFIREGVLSPRTTKLVFGLLTVSFSIKAGLILFWSWLPTVMDARTPVSALFHAVVIVVAGIVLQGRVFGFTFDPALLAAMGLNWVVIILAGATIIVSSLIAFKQTHLKKILAYCTIDHMAYIALAFAMLDPNAWTGGIMHIFFHGTFKITMFFAAGAIHLCHHVDHVTEMKGIGRAMPVTTAFFTIGVLGAVSMPLMGTFASKMAIMESNPVVMILLLLSSALNAGVFFPIVREMWFGASEKFPKGCHRQEADRWLLVPMSMTAVMTVINGVFPNFGFRAYDLGNAVAKTVVPKPVPLLTLGPAPSWLYLVAGLCGYYVFVAYVFPWLVWSFRNAHQTTWIAIQKTWDDVRQIQVPRLKGVSAAIVLFIISAVVIPRVTDASAGNGANAAWWEQVPGFFAMFGGGVTAIFIVGSLFVGALYFQQKPNWYDMRSPTKAVPMILMWLVLIGVPVWIHFRGVLPKRVIADIPTLGPTDVVGVPIGMIVLLAALIVAVCPTKPPVDEETEQAPTEEEEPPSGLLNRLVAFTLNHSQRVREALCIFVPFGAFFYFVHIARPGESVSVPWLDKTLVIYVTDQVNLSLGAAFSFVGFLWGVFSACLKGQETVRNGWNHRHIEQVAGLVYLACTLNVTFAGDYVSLIMNWEIMAVAPVIFLYIQEDEKAQAAGSRYLYTHIVGGALLLGGMVLRTQQTGSMALGPLDPATAGLAEWMMFAGVAVNAAIPPSGSWLADAYTRATPTGAILMNALTTKSAVYVLIRLFPGWDVLWIAGVSMALLFVMFAVLANGPRQMLAYHIMSQLGYMVTAVGIGTEVFIVGALLHNICHQVYKSTMFMAVGIVEEATGETTFDKLGGVARVLPRVFILYMMGAAAICGIPYFAGFVSKGYIQAMLHHEHYVWTFFLLTAAAVGTFLHGFCKLVYQTFLGERRFETEDLVKVVANRKVALVFGAIGCFLLGANYAVLYDQMPYQIEWDPYTPTHFMEVVQICIGGLAVFWMFIPVLKKHAPMQIVEPDAVFRHAAPAAKEAFVEWPSQRAENLLTTATDVAKAAIDLYSNGMSYKDGRLRINRSPEATRNRRRDEFGANLVSVMSVAVALVVIVVIK